MKFPHWQYYKSILGDIEVLSRYIELSQDNYRTYGIELTRIFLSVGSEIDVIAKLLCKEVNSEADPDTIDKYREILKKRFPRLPTVEISIPRYLISLKPWSEWLNEKNPEWWSCYNKVKHKRDEYFREANLENVLLATAGLCVFISYLYHDSISLLSGIIPPLIFLDKQYQTKDPSILTKRSCKLPDFNHK